MKFRDPVCGMMVEPKTAAAKREHKGKTFYFCAKHCAAEFDKDPDRYAEEKEEESHEHGPSCGHLAHHAHMVADYRRRFWVSLGLTIPVLLLSPAVQQFLALPAALSFPGAHYLQLLFASAVYFYGGWPFLAGAWDELRARQPGMMTLIGVAISAAFIYSAAVVFGLPGMEFFWELATLIDVMLLGHWIEMRSILGASRALEELARLLPALAHRLRPDGTMEDVPIEALRPNDRVVIKPGEKIPADGVVIQGRTTVNEAMLTGESRPVEKDEGDEVIGGAINGEAAIVVEVRRTGAETYVAQVIKLVRQAQEARSRTQDLANRAAFWLTLIAVGGGLSTFLSWLAAGAEPSFAVTRMVTVMVIACPHALGLAIPLVVAVSTGLAARKGFLIRNRSAFERARSLTTVVFDKTGTLTLAKFGVTDVLSFSEMTAEEILQLAAAVEARSEHPIAAGIVAAAKSKGLAIPEATEVRAIPGRGVEGRVNGRIVKVVSPTFLAGEGRQLRNGRVENLARAGRTVVHLVLDGAPKGAIALADLLRAESTAAVRKLREMGIKVMMLTGDSPEVAAWVARELALDEYFAGVLPHKKAEIVKKLGENKEVVAMVGDGINDAPALVAADVGIAIGAGTNVAIESADIVLVRNDPTDVATVVELGRATYRKMVQNLGWATGYNAFAIPLAAGALHPLGVDLSPALAAALMALSTVIVAINARRLRI